MRGDPRRAVAAARVAQRGRGEGAHPNRRAASGRQGKSRRRDRRHPSRFLHAGPRRGRRVSTLAFADPVFESQAAFRAILAAMARPGAILACGEGLAPPAPLSPAAAAAILALADFETPLWIAPSLLAGEIASYLKFNTGAPLAASPDKAAFALIDAAADALRLADFAQGTQEYPDRSTTIVVQLSSLSN